MRDTQMKINTKILFYDVNNKKIDFNNKNITPIVYIH